MKEIPPIIGFCGQATAGKTTVVLGLISVLGSVRLVRVSFADPIRDMLKVLHLSNDELADKNAKNPKLCGKTVRHAMQTLGTDWARQCIGNDVWVNAAMKRARDIVEVYDMIALFDDVRFDNEAQAIRDYGGIVIKIERHDLPPPMLHASEAGVSPGLINHVVDGTDGIIATRTKVLAIVNDYGLEKRRHS